MALADGLLAWWNFNEDTAPYADSIGGGGNITATVTDGTSGGVGGPAASRGVRCIASNASYYQASTTPDLSNTSYSVAAYAMLTTPSVSQVLTNVFSKYNSDATGANFALQYQLKAPLGTATSALTPNVTFFPGVLQAGTKNVFSAGASYRPPDGSNVPVLNKWHHLAGTWDHVNGVALLYFDGILVAAKSVGSTQRITSDTSTLRIGAAYTAGNHFTFDGLIDCCGIWNRILSPSEIGDLFLTSSGRQYPFSYPTQA